MRIEKTINGEKFRYYCQFIPNTMMVTVRYHMVEDSIKCKISDDFKYIILPDDFMSPYISGIGKVKVKKLKLNRQYQNEAKDYNGFDVIKPVKPVPVVNNNVHVQVVKMNTSIIEYFKMIVGFQNESPLYRHITENEFKYELTKALNCDGYKKEIVWVDEKNN